jgi:hypothetical protein
MGLFNKKSKYDKRMKRPIKFYNSPISEECYNLDTSFINFIVPRLKLFKKDASRVIIYDFSIIDDILKGFELYQKVDEWENDKEIVAFNMKIVNKSMELFAKHWMEFNW